MSLNLCRFKILDEENFDSRVYKLFEAFQSLEDSVFRLDEKGSASGYKHSTAEILKMLGVIESAKFIRTVQILRAGDEAKRCVKHFFARCEWPKE